MSARLSSSWRFIAGLPRFLKEPISYDAARAIILRRMEERNQNFLRMVRRCVYDNPSSPYLPLLRDAGCAYGDLESYLARHELEALLARLKNAGVWIAFDEYKGRTPIVRSGKAYPVRETDFDNAMLRGGWEFSTGGSSGRPSRMLMDLDFLADRSPYEQIMLRLLDIERVPLAVWYPKLPASIGLTACLRYAKVGKPADHWFDMKLAGRAMPAWHSWALSAIVGVSRLAGAPVPSAVAAPIDAPGIILDWIVESVAQHGRCALQCNVSSVVRLCRAATARGIDLRGVQFLAGSEPLTPAKHAEIVATGARVFLRYFAIDLGSIGAGCGAPDGADEVHLLSDNVTLVSSSATADDDGAARLYFTSIMGSGPKVVINVEFGDQAVVSARACGCPYEELGFHTHLSRVRSATRSTAEGIALPYADLIRIAEDVLPCLLGGSVLDYQWVEDEEPESGSLTRVWLRIAPRLGPIDEAAVLARVLEEIGRPDGVRRFYAQLWEQTKTIGIVRQSPATTPSGKTPAVMKGRH